MLLAEAAVFNRVLDADELVLLEAHCAAQHGTPAPSPERVRRARLNVWRTKRRARVAAARQRPDWARAIALP